MQNQATTNKGVGTSVPLTLDAVGTAARTLILELFHSTSTAPTSVGDGSWTRRDDGTGPWFLYDKIGGAGSVAGVTATFPGSGAFLAKLSERDDIASFDKFKQSSGTTATPTSTNTANVDTDGELALGMHASPAGSNVNFVGTNGFTADAGTGLSSGRLSDGTNGNCAFFSNKVLGAAGAGYAATAGSDNVLSFSAIATYRLTASSTVDDDQTI